MRRKDDGEKEKSNRDIAPRVDYTFVIENILKYKLQNKEVQKSHA